MNAANKPDWGSSYRLIAADKWKTKSAAMGRDVTQALVDYARPGAGMKVLDLAGIAAIAHDEVVGERSRPLFQFQNCDFVRLLVLAGGNGLGDLSFQVGSLHAVIGVIGWQLFYST